MAKITYPTLNLQQPGNAGMNVEQLLQNALGMHRAGQLESAEKNYRLVLKAQPKNAYVLNMLGVLNSQKNNYQEGEKLLRKAVKIDPEVADYQCNLAQCLQEQKKSEGAESAYKKALKINPDFIPALFGLANVSLQLKKPEQAIEYYKRTIEKEPRYLPACNNLGNLYREMKLYDEAHEMFNRVIEFKPDFAEGWYNLGVLYFSREDGHKAKEALEKAIELKPDYYRAYFKLGDCYDFLLQDHSRAVSEYDRVIEIKPDFIPAYLHKAGTYNSMGKFDEAEKTLRRALDVDESAIDVYLKLIFGKVFNEKDVKKVQDALKNENLNRKQLIDIHFSLGDIFDNRKEYDKAFRHYHDGNMLHRESIEYNPDEFSEYISGLIEIFNERFIASHALFGMDTELPVFIVGMPRSGTTLTEQILASHPEIYGAGESDYMNLLAREFSTQLMEDNPGPVLSESSSLSGDKIKQLADKYMVHIKQLSKKALCIIDKTPGNYKNLGLIFILFPNAKIIHCQRNPLDTCLSVYFHHFKESHPYSYDLGELGLHYREYLRLMAHWNTVIGKNILNVNYEDMVNDQEVTSRKLIDFLGLDWDEKCLHFYETERSVKTWSQWQVRQKVYIDSVNRWKHYEKWIEPLIKVLE